MKEDTPEYWFELGKYHSKIKNTRSAINSYRKCIKNNPKFFQAWSNLAAEYFQLKDYQNSIECCKEAIRVNEKDKHAWLTLAANYFQLNDDGRASFCFDRASILGSKKAKQFLEKATKLKDKLLKAEVIDVASEILEIEEIKPLENEIKAVEERYYRPEPPALGDKDYIKKLRGFLLEIGNRLIYTTGGIISVLELYSYIKKEYPSFESPPRDVLKALKGLKKNGLIDGIKKLADIKIVEFVPSGLTSDLQQILNLAAQKGYLTLEELMAETSWSEYRIMKSMDFLERRHIARKVESYREGKKWFFPTLDTE